MCIIILNKKGLLSKETIKNCWENNSDGAGMMYSINNKLEIFKELKNFNKFYNHYVEVRKEYPKKYIGLHFRIATHGLVNEENLHPYEINENLYVMHNGIITINSNYNNVHLSDTAIFVNDILKKLPEDFLYQDHLVELIRGYIDNSKLLFMDNKGKAWILNSDLGEWTKDNWFSNNTYKFSSYKYYKNYNKYYKHNPTPITSTTDYINDNLYCKICMNELKTDREIINEVCNRCYDMDWSYI